MEIHLDRSTTPFDLEHTLSCGQVFRWEKRGYCWYGVVDEKAVKISQGDDKLVFKTFPGKVDNRFFEDYFRLDDNLPHILSQISKDKYVERAIRASYGLRIIRQNPWECLISYMCATNKNIPAIKSMIFNLCKGLGEKITVEDHDFYAFPEPSALAEADLGKIKGCKLGFRTERVLQVSRTIAGGGFDLEALRKMDYEKAKLELLSLSGVGQKVADCVLLFSFDNLEAFPVDIWMRRIILEVYPNHFERSFIKKILGKRSITRGEYEKISSFGRGYFGEYAGYAQEYLFHYRRC